MGADGEIWRRIVAATGFAARMVAILGGMVLLCLVALTVVSVSGRGVSTFLHASTAPDGVWGWVLHLGIGPLSGDFEIVEAGIAFAVFSFLPICQLERSHAQIDVFANRLPPAWQRRGQMLIDTGFAVVLGVVAWRLGAGMVAKLRYGETSFFLQFPLWWAYAACLPGAVLAAVAAIVTAISTHAINASAAG